MIKGVHLLTHALLLAGSVLMNILSAGLLRNDFCKKEIHGSADLHTFNALSSALSALTLAAAALFGGSLCLPSLSTLKLGVFLVIAFIVSALFSFIAAHISLRKGKKATVLAEGHIRKLIIFSIVCGILQRGKC